MALNLLAFRSWDNITLGQEVGSWGFHSDKGCLVEGDHLKKRPYSTPCSVGDIIGCYFDEDNALDTKNGKVIE
ncbi:hypothetical protein GGR53DRAFT_497458 [Hypoxylon sp. FL1150]|nr:hypothetical protein GGR53DRAFT_497458 [Hypoxylon sp. FL1150]